ncbi:hypothetical protein PPNK14_29930 [Pectobacterium parmentieri]
MTSFNIKKSQKKTLHHGGQKDRDGVYGKEKQGVYLLHIYYSDCTTLTDYLLHYYSGLSVSVWFVVPGGGAAI